MAEEVRYTDPNTGAQKGVKKARFDLIPPKALFEIAEHYGVGAEKYAEHNFRKGYPWGHSFAALNRHLWAFWLGEDYDDETGSKHIISAAWHCIALSTFMDDHPELDNRYKFTRQELEEENKIARIAEEAYKYLSADKLEELFLEKVLDENGDKKKSHTYRCKSCMNTVEVTGVWCDRCTERKDH